MRPIGITKISPSLLAPSRVTPRTRYLEAKISRLAAKLRLKGDVDVPIIVEFVGGSKPYEVIAGERRRRAAIEAELTSITVEVRAFNKVGVEGTIQRSETAWSENADREELHPLDCSEFILNDLIKRTKLGKDNLIATLQDIASNIRYKKLEKLLDGHKHGAVGASIVKTIIDAFEFYDWKKIETFVRVYIPLVQMPEDIREAYRTDLIKRNDANQLNRLKQEKQRAKIIKRLEDAKITRKDVENEVLLVLGEEKLQPTISLSKRLALIRSLAKTANFNLHQQKEYNHAKQKLEQLQLELEQQISRIETLLRT
jgi:ParB family transcriptional regulator, chromosome partitioning protein